MKLWKYIVLTLTLLFPLIPYLWFFDNYQISLLSFLIPFYIVLLLISIALSLIPNGSFLDKRKEDYVLVPLMIFPYLIILFEIPFNFYSLSICLTLVLLAILVLTGK